MRAVVSIGVGVVAIVRVPLPISLCITNPVMDALSLGIAVTIIIVATNSVAVAQNHVTAIAIFVASCGAVMSGGGHCAGTDNADSQKR